jgi:hypothetical protein
VGADGVIIASAILAGAVVFSDRGRRGTLVAVQSRSVHHCRQKQPPRRLLFAAEADAVCFDRGEE